MNVTRQGQSWLASIVVAMVVVSSSAQNATNLTGHLKISRVPVAIMPPSLPPSPINYFRNLLAMSPQQRENLLAGKSPAVRARILAKLNEYAALDPNERELRLRATELRWYLMPLLRASPSERDAQLAAVPANIRDVVKSRLLQWEILPPSLQQEFLENEHIVEYFSGVGATNNSGAEAGLSDADQSRWNALSDDEHKAMIAQFNGFFALAPVQKQKALGALPAADRARMQKAMQIFDQLPEPQKDQCIQAFTKFAGMSPLQRTIFLRNAQRWAQMSPSERKAWGDLVDHVPQWPPMPVAPPMPPGVHVGVITNHS